MKKCKGCSHPTICNTHGCAAEEARLNKERRVMRRLSTEIEMQIGKNEIDIKFTVREAQSLLMVLRRVNATQGRAVDMHGIPIGAKDDMRYLQSELERALLMDKKVGA